MSQDQQLPSEIAELLLKLQAKGIISKQNNKYVVNRSTYEDRFPISLGFENIAITQSKNICNSRLDADIESEVIKGIKLKIPMIAANMSTVVNSDFCIALSKLGAMGIMHRALPTDEMLTEVSLIADKCDVVAASLGIEQDQLDVAKKLINHGANVLCIDVAHGYSERVFDLARDIKKYFTQTKVIVGNTVNPEMLRECYTFVDAVKVGIAQGLACETKNTAGCTEKQFSAVLKFKELSKELGVPVISDGGIREPADFTKAIAAGANSVMAGSIFAACPESAADIVMVDDKKKKLYAGMASEYIQSSWKGGLKAGTAAEGGVRYLDIGLPLEKLLERYGGSLRSGITYAGADNIDSFQKLVSFVRLS